MKYKYKYISCLLLVLFTFTGCYSSNKGKELPFEYKEAVNISDSFNDTINESSSIPANEDNKIKSEYIENISVSNDSSISKVDEIIEIIPDIIGENKDKISLYYYNFDSNEEYYLNEDTYYVSASLKKVPLAMQVLDKVANGELSLDTEIEYLPVDYLDGTGILQFEENIGKRTVKELIILSMIESDNIAFNMLNRTCDYTLIEYVNDMLGYDAMIVENDISKLTARHIFEILYNLYTNKNNNPHYNLIIDSLKDTAFNDSINKYLPKGSVSHKIGSYYRYYHDSAIVFGEETYILVILTKDIGELVDSPEFSEDDDERNLVDWGKQAFELMAVISKEIYNIINN